MVLSRDRCVPGPGESEQAKRRTRCVSAWKRQRVQAPRAGQRPATSGPAAAGGRPSGRSGTTRGGATACCARSGERRTAPRGRAAIPASAPGALRSGTVQSRIPPGREHPGALAQHGRRLRHVLKHARRDHRVEAAGRERKRAPPGVKPDPAHGLRPVSHLGLAEHLRRDVAAGHPVAGAPPGAARAPRCRSRGRAVRRRRRPGPDGAGELCQPSGQRSVRRVLGWPAGRLCVEQRPYPVRVVRPRPGRVAGRRSGYPWLRPVPPPRLGSWPAWWRASPRSAVPRCRRPPAGKPPASARCPLS